MNPKYMYDPYLKEYRTKVKSAEGKSVVLEDTIFYPASGGQPTDLGYISDESGERYNVISVKKSEGKIVHELDREGLKEGDGVVCHIDWERRYKLMRSHTATHMLCTVFMNESGALITGNQLDIEQVRMDFSLENFDREKIDEYARKANEMIGKNLEIKTYFLKREEAMKIPGIVKLASALPPQAEELRIVEIGSFDIQADGGTHVKNTSEIGMIEVIRCENKGKANRRVYFRLK